MKPERFDDLCGVDAKQTGVILTNGPSLSDFSDGQLAAICAGRPVIAVKQAYLRYPTARYHVVSRGNLQDYRRDPETITLGCAWVCRQDRYWEGPPIPCDFFFPYFGEDRQIRFAIRPNFGCLAATGEWSRSLFSHSIVRHWGPGIMMEMVVPLAIHLGWSRAVVVAWDQADPAGERFDHAVSVPKKKAERMDPFLQWDNNIVIATSAEYHAWMQTQGLTVNILSSRTFLRMPRISFKEAVP
jgi:hypothetical protein